jgi:hypothetical protein
MNAAKARVDLKKRQEQNALRDKQERDAAAAEEAKKPEKAAEEAAEEAAAQKLAAPTVDAPFKAPRDPNAPQGDLFGGEDAVIESGDQSSDGVLKQGDTGADTGGGSSAGTGKAVDQRLGDGQPKAADVGTGEGVQPSALDTPIATFTTEKGSTYELFPDATTTRNRAPRDDNEVSGPQPRSGKTIFMSTKAVNVGVHIPKHRSSSTASASSR